MTDANYYNSRAPYYYPPQQENANFVSSNSYIRNNQESFTPQHSRMSNVELTNTQFVPKIIESGYIVGPPIAYTQAPSLPPNFHAFSPAKSSLPIMFDSSLKPTYDYGNSNSKLIINQPPHSYVSMTNQLKTTAVNQPSIIIHSPGKSEETVSKMQYDRCMNECKNWETKYNELYLRYSNVVSGQNQESELQDENRKLRQRIRELELRERSEAGSSKNIRELIEKYKESTLKQCFLLLDRYRLECKQRQ